MSNKLVVVLGATGKQGGSVVTALLNHGKYAVRGVTRNPDAPAAKALNKKGVEVVAANLADKETLVKAFGGAYAVFGVTIPFTEDSEELQGRNIVDAAKLAKVPLLVWSSLPSATETSNGKYTTIYHFDQKNAVDKYIASAGQPTVIVHTGGFAENLLMNLFGFRQLQPDPTQPNKWTISFPIMNPDSRIQYIWIEADLGNIVVAIIDHWEDKVWRERLTKEPIVAAPYSLSGAEMAQALSKEIGQEFTYVRITDVPELLKPVFNFANEHFETLYPQSRILEELGVTTHTFKDFVRAKVVPYIQSMQ